MDAQFSHVIHACYWPTYLPRRMNVLTFIKCVQIDADVALRQQGV